MHVIATAGHVDHGKSTLVRALTGVDPDRLEDERRRGLSIQLGYCWTSLPDVGEVAFVDVPGHERFIVTMLSGIGPVPAVLFVVAADDPWMPQAAEHLAAIDALGVSRGVLAVTRSDLVDPAPALERARGQLGRTSLRDSPSVTVSGRTGSGLDELRALLVDMVGSLPVPDPEAGVRLWVDRCFHMKGAGTVVTGTLPAGRISVGDIVTPDGSRAVRVRGVQSLGKPVESAVGVSRVALNVTGVDVNELNRSSVLVTPDRWLFTDVVDVRVQPPRQLSGEYSRGHNPRLNGPQPTTQRATTQHSTQHSTRSGVPARPVLHLGATSVAGHFRPLGDGLARLTLDRPVPLRIGDRALLRDPGSRAVWGVTILDPAPPPLNRRGAAARRASELAGLDGRPDTVEEISRREIVRLSLLERIGIDTGVLGSGTGSSATEGEAPVVAGDWVLSAARAVNLRAQIRRLVEGHDQEHPLAPGVPIAAVAQAVGLPEVDLVPALVEAPLGFEDGRVTSRRDAVLPPSLERTLARLTDELADAPFAAPTADRLGELGLDRKAVGAAAKAGRLLRVADGIVLLPGADRLAVTWLGDLPQPFTTSQARVRLDTSRRVVLPLLAHLDRLGLTRRLEDDRRTVRPA